MEALFGRLHPLLVHLPIGMVLMAAVLEWVSARRPESGLAAALPLIWKTAAAAALLAALTGWLLGRSGAYEPLLLNRHQYFGLAAAACATAAGFLPQRRAFSLLCAVLLLMAAHWGSALTHGEHYLSGTPQSAPAPPEHSADELPDLPVEAARAADIDALRQAGLSVVPLAAGSPWLDVRFVNAGAAAPDSLFSLLAKIAPQVSRLNLHGVAVPESGWPTLARCQNLTRLNLSSGKVEDRHLAYLAGLPYLQHLNLSQTAVQLQDPAALAKLPALRRLFLYKTAVVPAAWPRVFQALPNVQIDTGGYVVPTLPTDTTVLGEKPKY